MNALANQLNDTLNEGNPNVVGMLSYTGRKLFFPKGILSQSAEAKEKAEGKFNATIGIATEGGQTMYLPSVMAHMSDLDPTEALTYAPSFGIPALRKAWLAEIFRKNPSLSGKKVSLPVVTNGITHGISIVADMFVEPDDVVIFPDKMWGNNNLIMTVRKHARISNYPMFTKSGGFNIEAFEKKVRQESEGRGKLIVFLNFPNNPTGYTITSAEADRILGVLHRVADQGTNVVAVTDDAYFGLFYGDCIRESMFAKLANLHPKVLGIKLDGATKEMFVWGLRVGFMTFGTVVEGDDADGFYTALAGKAAGNIRGTVSSACHMSQSIVLKTLQSETFEAERIEKSAILERRAAKVKEVLADPKYNEAWDVYPFNSGYFMCLKLKTVDAELLRIHLLDKYQVGLIAVDDTDLRVAFSCMEEENIPALFDIVLAAIKELED